MGDCAVLSIFRVPVLPMCDPPGVPNIDASRGCGVAAAHVPVPRGRANTINKYIFSYAIKNADVSSNPLGNNFLGSSKGGGASFSNVLENSAILRDLILLIKRVERERAGRLIKFVLI